MSRLGIKLIRSLKEISDTTDLYKDKPLLYRIKMALYTSDLLDPLFQVYYTLSGFFDNLRRVIEFLPYVWSHRDWDYGFILRFNVMLHQRLYKGIFDKGHAVYTPKDTRRLKTIIALYKRLEEDQYEDYIYDEEERLFGPNDIYFTEIEPKEGEIRNKYVGLSRMRSTREDRMSVEEQAKYWKYKKTQYAHAEAMRKQDFELLGKMITKYSRNFWD